MTWGFQVVSIRMPIFRRRVKAPGSQRIDICECPSPHWQTVVLDNVPDVPGMTQPDELRYFYWCCATHHQAGRRVVELGPYVGRSTVALAAGLRDSAEPGGKLVSIDCFEWNAWALENTFEDTIRGLSESQRATLSPGAFQPKEGDSFFRLFEVFTEPLKNSIHGVNATLESYEWCGEPIDVLMIDAAKSWDALDQIVRQFFPCLIDGAVVIHQDYKHFFTYWLHPVTERMLERGVLSLGENVAGTPTQGFRFHKKVDFRVTDYLHTAFSPAEADRLIARSRRRFRGEHERLAVAGAHCRLLKELGQLGRAREAFTQAICDGGFSDNYALVDLLTVADGWHRPLLSTLLEGDSRPGEAANHAGMRKIGINSIALAASSFNQQPEFPLIDTAGFTNLAMNFHADCHSEETIRIRVEAAGSDLPSFYDEEFLISPGCYQPVIIPVADCQNLKMRWTAASEGTSRSPRELHCIAPLLITE